MPPPLSLRLTSRQRGLLPIIRSGVASGLSSRSINAAIRRAEGVGMNRQILLDVMRELSGIKKHGETLRFVRLDQRPDPNRLKAAITPIRRGLSSTVRVRGFLLGTGQRVERFVQVTHDAVLTRGQIEDIASSFFDDAQEDQFSSTSGMELESTLLVEQVRRA